MAAWRMKGGVTRSVSPNQSGRTSGCPRPKAVTLEMPDGSRLRMTGRMGSGRGLMALLCNRNPFLHIMRHGFAFARPQALLADHAVRGPVRDLWLAAGGGDR